MWKMDFREARLYTETRQKAIMAAQARKSSCEDKADGSAEKWAYLGYVLLVGSEELADGLHVGRMGGGEEMNQG